MWTEGRKLSSENHTVIGRERDVRQGKIADVHSARRGSYLVQRQPSMAIITGMFIKYAIEHMNHVASTF